MPFFITYMKRLFVLLFQVVAVETNQITFSMKTRLLVHIFIYSSLALLINYILYNHFKHESLDQVDKLCSPTSETSEESNREENIPLPSVTGNYRCTKPVTSIVYLKTHKTGSTSWKSVFLFYGEKRNLTICMDSVNKWQLNWPYRIHIERIIKPHYEKCNILADEMVYDEETVRKLMPSTYVTITSVRHPIEHFFSMYRYVGIHKAVERLTNKTLEKFEAMRIFFKHPLLLQNIWATYSYQPNVQLMQPNLQLYTLGLNTTNPQQILKMSNKINYFIISEFNDESLVLLKKGMCCQFEDLLYRKQNVGRSGKKEEVVPKDIKQSILKFNQGDLILYNIALKRYRQQVKAYRHFENDVKVFREKQKIYQDTCLHLEKKKDPTLNKKCIPKDFQTYFRDVHERQKSRLTKNLRAHYKKLHNQ